MVEAKKTKSCWSEHAVILQLSSNVQYCLSFLQFFVFFFFWCDIMNFFVFWESKSSFPFLSCTWLEFDEYTVLYASLCSAQLQCNVCVCVCVCTGTHRWDIPGKTKSKQFFLLCQFEWLSFTWWSLAHTLLFDMNCHNNLTIMQIPDPASRGLWYVSLFH